MTDYLIIRTAHKREDSVAREISRHYPAWVPSIKYIHAKKLPSQKKALVTLKQRPLMATYVFAAVPVASVADLHAIDGFDAVEYGNGSWTPLSIPEIQIDVFRQMIDRENVMLEAHHRRLTLGKAGKQIKKFRGLGEDVLREVAKELFGIEQDMQEAA